MGTGGKSIMPKVQKPKSDAGAAATVDETKGTEGGNDMVKEDKNPMMASKCLSDSQNRLRRSWRTAAKPKSPWSAQGMSTRRSRSLIPHPTALLRLKLRRTWLAVTCLCMDKYSCSRRVRLRRIFSST